MFSPAWSYWVRRFTAHTAWYPQLWGKSSLLLALQSFICPLPDSADCQGVLGMHLQLTGQDVLQNSHLWGNCQQLTPMARRAILSEGEEENWHTAGSPHTPMLCSLQIQLCFLPVTQIPQLHIAVASAVGATISGLSAQHCKISVQPWASQLRPGHSGTLPSMDNISVCCLWNGVRAADRTDILSLILSSLTATAETALLASQEIESRAYRHSVLYRAQRWLTSQPQPPWRTGTNMVLGIVHTVKLKPSFFLLLPFPPHFCCFFFFFYHNPVSPQEYATFTRTGKSQVSGSPHHWVEICLCLLVISDPLLLLMQLLSELILVAFQQWQMSLFKMISW